MPPDRDKLWADFVPRPDSPRVNELIVFVIVGPRMKVAPLKHDDGIEAFDIGDDDD